MGHLRDLGQKQSVSVNSAGVCVRAVAPADFLILEASLGLLLWSQSFPLFLERVELFSLFNRTDREGQGKLEIYYGPNMEENMEEK